MNYRKDVQVLRGVAVLLVVLFHLELAGFQSGFLGVDVFFVISGYLMAVMYRPEDKRLFFARRANRLLPAYFATLTATVMAALLVTTPTDFSQVARQGWFAALFASNVGFWLENSYFDKVAFKPLLHLWSLGVEIQFYLLVPALYWIIQRTRTVGYVCLAAGSAAACFYLVGISPKTSFFWLPFRLWEFLLGFGVATYLAASRRATGARWAGSLCLLTILLIPLVRIDGSVPGFAYGHPGLAALTISGATAGVLLFGLPRWLERNPVATVFERAGDYSYSIYLAHFPIVVLVLYQAFSGTVLSPKSVYQLITVAVAIAAGSTILYHFVEKPLRHGPLSRRWVGTAAAAVFLLCAGGGWLQNAPLSIQERAVYAAWEDRSVYRCGKLNRILHPRSQSCELTDGIPNPSNRILLVGNSHADAIKDTFAVAATSRNASIHFMVDNAPLMEGGMGPEALLREALALGVESIVMHYSPRAVSPEVIEKVAQLAARREIKVAFIMPVPVWDRHVPKMLWAAMKRDEPLSKRTIEDYLRENATLSAALAQLQAPNLRVYQVAPMLCAPDCHLTTPSGEPLYFDATHLTRTGSAVLRPLFDTVVQDLMAGATRPRRARSTHLHREQ